MAKHRRKKETEPDKPAEPAESEKSGEIAVIGDVDNWEADVRGAQKAGLTPLWFCRNKDEATEGSVRKIKSWPELNFLLDT